jgi:hypothetical protein
VSSSNLTLNNTIVAGNFRGASPGSRDDVFVNVAFGSFIDPGSSNNLIGVDTGLSDISNGNSGNQIGTAAVPIDPRLGALANNGGPTKTHFLLSDSPALNAGSNGLALSETGSPLTTDQRGTGFPRINNTRVDIGAFEANYTITATAGTPQSTVVNTAFATQLQATVKESGNNQSGVTVTFTAPVSGASGTFTGGLMTVNAITNASGVATAPVFTANATSGSYNVTASISGGLPSTTFALTNTPASQTITVNTHAPSSATYNSSFTVAATSSSGLTVTYSSSGACTNVGATFTMTSGTGTCTVKYDQSGNGTYSAAPQVTESVTAVKATTSTAGSSSVNPSNSGQSVTFTATVTSSAGTPTGTVTFKDNGVAISGCSNKPLTSGQATCDTAALAPGNHPITADYSADSNFNTSTGTLAGGQVVNSEVSVTVSPASVAEDGVPNLVYTFTRNGVTASALTINFSVGGTATFTTDYSQTGAASFNTTAGTVTFDAGNSTATVTINPSTDTELELNETVILTVTAGSGYEIVSPTSATGTITNDDTALQLLLDPEGPASNQAVAVDSILFVRDPFPIDRLEKWFNFPGDDNTRVMLFAYFQLLPGETANDVVVEVIDSASHVYNVTAEDVRLVDCPPCSQPMSQIVFRLPDMPAGTVTVRVKVHALTSNAGTFRVTN